MQFLGLLIVGHWYHPQLVEARLRSHYGNSKRERCVERAEAGPLTIGQETQIPHAEPCKRIWGKWTFWCHSSVFLRSPVGLPTDNTQRKEPLEHLPRPASQLQSRKKDGEQIWRSSWRCEPIPANWESVLGLLMGQLSNTYSPSTGISVENKLGATGGHLVIPLKRGKQSKEMGTNS